MVDVAIQGQIHSAWEIKTGRDIQIFGRSYNCGVRAPGVQEEGNRRISWANSNVKAVRKVRNGGLF